MNEKHFVHCPQTEAGCAKDKKRVSDKKIKKRSGVLKRACARLRGAYGDERNRRDINNTRMEKTKERKIMTEEKSATIISTS